MNVLFSILFIQTIINGIDCDLSIGLIKLRSPYKNDLGLVFDATLTNDPDSSNAQVPVIINGVQCCIYTQSDEVLCKIPPIVGGNFGSLGPGKTIIVSLIWPTSIIYNRRGFCDIQVNKSITNKIEHRIYFNTEIKFGEIPEVIKSFVKDLDVKNCSSLDQDPFENCKPIDCSEKYFGQLSYYDYNRTACVEVPSCIGKNIIYNGVNNKCVDIMTLDPREIQELTKNRFERDYVDPEDPDILNLNCTSENKNTTTSSPYKWAIYAFIIAVSSLIIHFSICFMVYLIIHCCSKPCPSA